MKSIRSRGFTLIELLVVIAIIGLLASIILASLNTAQQKGRDARRVSDLQEIGQEMVANDSAPGNGFTCGASGTAFSACTNGANTSMTFTYNDPSAAATTYCAQGVNTSPTPCNYTIFYTGGAPSTKNFEICAHLETGSGTLTSGAINVSSANSGSVTQNCP